MTMTSPSKKLNVGCGGKPLDGYVNLDRHRYDHVDILHDLESSDFMRWSGTLQLVADDYFDEIVCIHTIEHIRNVLGMMQELWRVAKPGCHLTIVCPYGSTDSADEDPTHVRRIFDHSFTYFSQAWYGRNSYGYSGDWELDTIMFRLKKDRFLDCQNSAQILGRIRTLRNVVDEFVAGLVAIKPARAPGFAPKTPRVQYKPV